jgi:uncharacterized membrane protein
MFLRTSTLSPIFLAASTFLGTVVFSFCLLFAAVIMPGIADLDNDADYLRAFQVMDGTIQNNQPAFLLCWMGSMLSVIALAVTTLLRSDAPQRLWMLAACLLFLTGHLMTIAGNIPLNNRIHDLDIGSADEATLAEVRSDFENPWMFWNNFRTVLFGVTSVFFLTRLSLEDLPFPLQDESFDSPPEVEARFQRTV